MFECDGSERTESAIIFFSFELGYSRRPAAYLSNDVGHPASGLAFGHSVCNKESSASSRTSFTTCHQDGQKLAGYVAKGRVIRVGLPSTASGRSNGLVRR